MSKPIPVVAALICFIFGLFACLIARMTDAVNQSDPSTSTEYPIQVFNVILLHFAENIRADAHESNR